MIHQVVRAVADHEIIYPSLDTTRWIFSEHELQLDDVARNPFHVATPDNPDWHRFYYPLDDGATYLLIVVSTAADPPVVEMSRYYVQRRVAVVIWSHTLSSNEIVARAQLDDQDIRSNRCSEPIGFWSIDSEASEPATADELVHAVLDQIEPSRQAIADLLGCGDANGCLNISVPHITDAHLSLFLGPQTLDRIASFGLTLTHNTREDCTRRG